MEISSLTCHIRVQLFDCACLILLRLSGKCNGKLFGMGKRIHSKHLVWVNCNFRG